MYPVLIHDLASRISGLRILETLVCHVQERYLKLTAHILQCLVELVDRLHGQHPVSRVCVPAHRGHRHDDYVCIAVCVLYRGDGVFICADKVVHSSQKIVGPEVEQYPSGTQHLQGGYRRNRLRIPGQIYVSVSAYAGYPLPGLSYDVPVGQHSLSHHPEEVAVSYEQRLVYILFSGIFRFLQGYPVPDGIFLLGLLLLLLSVVRNRHRRYLFFSPVFPCKINDRCHCACKDYKERQEDNSSLQRAVFTSRHIFPFFTLDPAQDALFLSVSLHSSCL